MDDKPPLRDMHEAAEWLHISWETLRKKVSARQVPCTKVFGQIRFSQEHLDAIVAAGEQAVATGPNRAQVIAIRAANPPVTQPPRTPPPPTGPRTPPPPSGPKKAAGQTEVNAV